MKRAPPDRRAEGPPSIGSADRPPFAIITGASAGIGRELARLAAADGYRTALVARRRERLEELCGELEAAYGLESRPLAVDLSTPEGPAAVMGGVEGERVEMLINNAGFATYGPFVDAALEETMDLIAVNMAALTELTRRCIPPMVGRGAGFVMNVASTAAFMPGPDMAAYYASKAYVLSLSEALVEELRGSGVRVTALCPGPTRTEFHDVAGMRDSPLVRRLSFRSASRVAERGYAGLKRGRTRVVPGPINLVTTLLPRFLPRALVPRIVAWVQSARGA